MKNQIILIRCHSNNTLMFTKIFKTEKKAFNYLKTLSNPGSKNIYNSWVDKQYKNTFYSICFDTIN